MIYLIRHGETSWSATGRHTGRSDIELTEAGRARARGLQPVLASLRPSKVLASPLRRAVDTATLAGFGPDLSVDDRLMEWDYGDAEGRTTAEMRESIPGWSVWTNEMTGGESLDEVAVRADAVVAELPGDDETDVVIVAHGHLLRILGARWCTLPAIAAQHLALGPASVSVLGHERSTPCLVRWNWAAGPTER